MRGNLKTVLLRSTSLPRVEQTFSITGTGLILHVSVVCSGRIVSI